MGLCCKGFCVEILYVIRGPDSARVSRAAPAPTQHTHYKLGDLGFSKKYVKSLGAYKYACFCDILTILQAIGAVPSSPNHGISKKTATAQKLVKV